MRPRALAPALTTNLASSSDVTPQILTKPGANALGTLTTGNQREGLNRRARIGRGDERLTHQHGVKARLRRPLDVRHARETRFADRDAVAWEHVKDFECVLRIHVEGVKVPLVDADEPRSAVD